jgi:hypothetical protein
MHYFFKFIFKIELYMFRTVSLSIIRSVRTVRTAIGICHTGYADCLLAVSQHNLCYHPAYQNLWQTEWYWGRLSEYFCFPVTYNSMNASFPFICHPISDPNTTEI